MGSNVMTAIPEGFRPVTDDQPQIPDGFRPVSVEDTSKSDNFFERFGDDLKVRFGEQGAEILQAHADQDQGFGSTLLQLTGKVGAGTVMDFLGEVIISGLGLG